MRTITILLLVIACMMATVAHAEFLEIQAKQIATIEPADKSASPRIVVKWDLPSSLDKKIIDGAVITMTVATTESEVLTLDVYPITSSWEANSVTWVAGWEEAGGDYDDSLPSTAIVTEKNEAKISADVYMSVRGQIAGKSSNYGFILVPEVNDSAKLSSITANDASKLADAKLIIAYRERR